MSAGGSRTTNNSLSASIEASKTVPPGEGSKTSDNGTLSKEDANSGGAAGASNGGEEDVRRNLQLASSEGHWFEVDQVIKGHSGQSFCKVWRSEERYLHKYTCPFQPAQNTWYSMLKLDEQGNFYTQISGETPILFKIDFCQLLPADNPPLIYDDCYAIATVLAKEIKIIPNSTVSNWIPFSDLIENELAILHDTKGNPLEKCTSMVRVFQNSAYDISVRFELSFCKGELFKPVLQVVAIHIPKNQTADYDGVIDLSTMPVATIGLTTVHPKNIKEADGTRFNLYPHYFSKEPITMKDYKTILLKNDKLRDFLLLCLHSFPHDYVSWHAAWKSKRTNNKCVFKPNTRQTKRKQLQPVEQDSAAPWSSGLKADVSKLQEEGEAHLRNVNSHLKGVPNPSTSYPLLATGVINARKEKTDKVPTSPSKAEKTKPSPANSYIQLQEPSSNDDTTFNESGGNESDLSHHSVSHSPRTSTPQPSPKHRYKHKSPVRNSRSTDRKKEKKHRKREHSSSEKEKTPSKNKKKKHSKKDSSSSDRENQPPPKPQTKAKSSSKKYTIPKKKVVPSETDSSSSDSDKEDSLDRDYYIKKYTHLVTKEIITEHSTLSFVKQNCGMSEEHVVNMLNVVFPSLALDDEFSQPHNLHTKLKTFTTMNKEAKEKSTKTGKVSMETLDANIKRVTKTRRYEAEEDNLGKKAHSRLFNKLSTLSGRKLFVMDAKRYTDNAAISSYDLSDVCGATQVTPQGWDDIQNPGNPNISVKNYMARNVQQSTTKQFGFEDSKVVEKDPLPSEGNSIQEVQKALAYFQLLMHYVHPAILVYHTLEIFLIERNWFASELYRGKIKQWIYATKVIDYFLGIFSRHYAAQSTPPTKSEMEDLLRDFNDTLNTGETSGSGPSTGPSRGRYTNQPNRSGSLDTSKNPCKAWNSSAGCPRSQTGHFCLVKDDTVKLLHLCNVKKDNGEFCKLKHKATQHIHKKE